MQNIALSVVRFLNSKGIVQLAFNMFVLQAMEFNECGKYPKSNSETDQFINLRKWILKSSVEKRVNQF